MNARNAARLAALAAERRDLVERRERLTGAIAPTVTRISVGALEVPASMNLRRCLLRDLTVETDLEIARIDADLAGLGLTVASTIAPADAAPAPYYLKDDR